MTFYKSDIYKVVRAFSATGNRDGVIRQWHKSIMAGACNSNDADIKALRQWLPYFQLRPFYSIYELAPIFPALALYLGISKTLKQPLSPQRLKNCLDFVGLPKLSNVNGTKSFMNAQGEKRQYYIVEAVHIWKKTPLLQIEFENYLK